LEQHRSTIGQARDALGRIVVRSTRWLESPRRVERAAREVAANGPRTLDEALDYAYNARPARLTIAPNQVASELREFLQLVREEQPRAVLEIGTALGGTLFLLTRAAAPDATIVSIDLSGDLRFGGGRVAQRRPLFEAFALDEQQVFFLAGDSHDPEMRRRVEAKLRGRPVDVLMIDGDHTEDGVRHDFELYSGLVRPGGLIAFHDIVDGRPDLVGGVPRFWRSVKTDGARELVEDPGQGGWGIGVLRR
jgi:predicted O-methyltransferase YrrM